jgi:hypothetical protein
MFANFREECICEQEKSTVMHATLSVILDTRRVKKSGTYPLKLQVTLQRKTRHFPPFSIYRKQITKNSALHA